MCDQEGRDVSAKESLPIGVIKGAMHQPQAFHEDLGVCAFPKSRPDSSL
jgi:hypothetical protein